MKRLLITGVAILAPVAAWAQNPPSPSGSDFGRIFEYTLFDSKTPDGKYQVWIYYETKPGELMKITMPSLDMCVITRGSERDLDLFRSGDYDQIQKNSNGWALARQIWKAAFDRYMLTGHPASC